MAPHFVFPPNLQALEAEPEDNRLYAQSPVDIASLRSSEVEEFVKGLSFDLSDKELFCVEEQDVFDRVYSLVRGFSGLPPSCKRNAVESLRSNLSVLLPNVDSLARQDDDGMILDRVGSHRNAFKIYTFFLLSIVLAEEASVGSGNNSKVTATARKKQPLNSWNWEQQRGRLLNLIANSLEINLSLLFGSSDPDENYLSFIAKIVFSMFENASLLKDPETKDALCRIIGSCASKYHYVAQSCASITHLIHKYDFVVSHMAEAVAGAEKKYADGSLASSLIREIGRTNPKDYVKDTVGAENVGRFLVELADRMPKLMSTNIGLLVSHFGGESYKIRNALVGVLGKLVAKAFKDVEGEVSSKSVRLRAKQAMLEILLERCRDVSAYTRSRVLQVWAELCEEHSVTIGVWNEVANVAAGRLEDKSAIVRKSALNLLITMLQHNPFGPQLRIASFETTLEHYKKKLDELEPTIHENSVTNGLSPEDKCNADGEIEDCNAETLSQEQQNSLPDSCFPHMDDAVTNKDSSVPDVGNLEQTRALVASLEAGLRFSKCVSATMPNLVQLMASSSATDVENTILLLMRCRQFQIDGSEACLRKMLPLVSALWDFFCFNVNGTTAEQSRGALSVLCMAAKSSAGILSAHIQDIIDIGFGRWAKLDPLLARTACIAIQRLSEEDKRRLMTSNGSRLFGILESLVTGFWLPENIWYAAADKAIGAIYTLHSSPETMAAELIKKSLNSVFDVCGGDEIQRDIENCSTSSLTTIQVAKLSKFLFVVSHVAMNQLLYIESCARKIRKQRSKKEKAENDGVALGEKPKENGINAELGLAASEDAFLDSLAERAEKEIISCSSSVKNLIGSCASFLSKLCRNFGLMQKYPELQASGMLALCRFMIIDASFCNANLQLLFTVIENSPFEVVRSNCTIALGDLAVRFPNLLEPWTENIYARLRDPSLSVRKNAVLVLSHLILNDMMKVKGYINEMAARLEDEDDRISSLAKLFFNELSKKGSNPIYNLLPDILGKLSSQNLKRESFCNIMQFLISSIKKDKQMEALVEKLCHRFGGVTDIRQWECISYCLSQLAFTEKGLKKLIELSKTYEHTLVEDSVMDHFKSILSKGKKFAKPELKTCLEEFEEKLNKVHAEKKEQEVTARNAQAHQEKMGSLETFTSACTSGVEGVEVDSNEEGEVINALIEDTDGSLSGNLNSTIKSEESSGVSSEVTESESGDMEIQSPKVVLRGSKSRAKEAKTRGETTNASASTRKNFRAKRRSKEEL
ncbi:hypothetical protein BT93_A1921 [Corymbia citriodora subsp. variegata]|nr:hypothetical protein BT93_A1921 [Corymbia citriodora subsp. variegata]